MTARDFCFWLQGYFEVNGAGPPTDACGLLCDTQTTVLTADQFLCIRKHLAMVFAHEIDPSFGGPEKQDVLDQLHHKGKADKPVMRC